MVAVGLCIVCLILQEFYGILEIWKTNYFTLSLKTLAAICFVVIGIMAFRISPDSLFVRDTLIGLCLGALGDFWLACDRVSKKRKGMYFSIGASCFFLGHLFYGKAFLPIIKNVWICVLAGIVVTVLVSFLLLQKITLYGSKKVSCLFYLGILTIMTSLSIFGAIQNETVYLIRFAVGAFLFWLSDIVLILYTYGQKKGNFSRMLNLNLYFSGQLFIAMSLFQV